MDKELEKKRAPAKAWVTRIRNVLHTETQKSLKDLDVLGLSEILQDLDAKLLKLDSIQEEYEVLLAPEALEEEVDKAVAFRTEVMEVRIRAKRLINKLQKQEDEDSLSSASTSSKPDVRLPKLVLPTFDGDVLQWQSWIDQFKAAIDDSNLPPITKFTYLRSLLTGEALEVIQGLSLTEKHYKEACELLLARYGRKEKVIFKHVQELLTLAVQNKTSTMSSLRKLQDKLQGHVRSLEALEIKSEQYGVLLTPIILSCLPHDIRIEWARKSEDKEDDLLWLLEFLDKEIRLRETSQTFKIEHKSVGMEDRKSLKSEERRHKEERKGPYVKKTLAVPAATALATSSDVSCGVCSGTHEATQCPSLLKAESASRRRMVQKAGLCYRCLESGHRSFKCEESTTCSNCGGKHHFFCCWEGERDNRSGDHPMRKKKFKKKVEKNVTTLTTGGSETSVIMQTLEIEVQGLEGKVRANVLFDGGSDRSYIAKDLVKRIRPELMKSEFVSYCAFGGDKPKSEGLRNIYSMEMRGLGKETECALVIATEVSTVCVPLHRSKVPDIILESLGQVKITERYDQDKKIKIDILIGLDQYWKFVQTQIIPVREGLVAQKTVFGWMISGAYGIQEGNAGTSGKKTSVQLFCVNSVEDQNLKRIWDMDLNPELDEEGDSSLIKQFEDTIKKKDGRYEVALPWKRNSGELQDNRFIAEQRLKSLSRKLEREPQLKLRYDEALRSMENEQIIEEVPAEEKQTENPTFYMPHRPVVKESSITTKVRPVFDASAKGANGVSLNDCMETGPNLLPNLIDILVRFRRWPVALASDIQKAFLQISVKREDRDVHRFLWEDGGKIRVMRFTRVPFGNKCSPFLLNATVKYHLKQYESTPVIEELEENLYVDDWLSGADEEEVATQMILEADAVMKEASMNLTKWGSNSREVLDQSLYNLADKCEHMCNVKVLGLGWDPVEDSFVFAGVNLESGLVITKRVVLSLIARLFDPLGFLTPFIIGMKCLFQRLWKLGLDWDQEIPTEFGRRVTEWIEDLKELKTWKIPRTSVPERWNGGTDVSLYAFGDASPDAYGACVYLVVEKEDGSRVSTLILSKSRVAPLKMVTLPRLELLGAVLVTQLVEFVRKALKLNSDCCYCWTDSMVTLGWIQDDPVRWKPFVANRVAQIQQSTTPSQWNHCPGVMNPADLVTRGISAEDLMKSDLWVRGPRFLEEDMPFEIEESVEPVDCSEELVDRDTTLVAVNTTESHKLEVDRWGKLTKALRVLAWIRRFVRNAKGSSKIHGDLTLEELIQAKGALIGLVQEETYSQEIGDLKKGSQVSRKSSIYKFSPFLDEDCLLRVKGRLDCTDLSYSDKHPIIIPKGHLAVLLVRFQHTLLKHAGVSAMLTSLRSEYWIVGVRRIAKRVKKQCVSCQKLDSLHLDAPAAPLPGSRVKKARPFSVVGLDHAGPLYCADRKGKVYILLFTCAVIRAVHLELVNSLNLEDFLLGFRRFVSRRGMPRIIWSDNAKTFVAAEEKLPKMFGPLSPRWNFIVPRSPWWGGWWERLVRSVKSGLKKTLKLQSSTRTELETILHEIEACINSRPLTFIGNDVHERVPLTPAHFLIGQSTFYDTPKGEDSVEDSEDLRNRLFVKKFMLEKFWNIWTNEYLRHLPQGRGRDGQPSVKVGDLVLIREDNRSRLLWPVGIVQEVYPGRDDVVRACKLKIGASSVVRPIQRIYNLEVEGPSENFTEVEDFSIVDTDDVQSDCDVVDWPQQTKVDTDDVQNDCDVVDRPQQTTRSGRIIKPITKLDL